MARFSATWMARVKHVFIKHTHQYVEHAEKGFSTLVNAEYRVALSLAITQGAPKEIGREVQVELTADQVDELIVFLSSARETSRARNAAL